MSLEPKSYLDCPRPGAADLSSRKLVPEALRRFSARAGVPVEQYGRLSYSEAAPCVLAIVANTVGALLTGHYGLSARAWP